MRVCLLIPTFDAFKGGNHLPLLAAASDIQFTILTAQSRPTRPELPPNVRIEYIRTPLGPYYYGVSDWLFARAVIRRFPASDTFWTGFDVLHLNQTAGPALLRLRSTGVPLCFFVHHPVSADREIVLRESRGFTRLRWRLRYALLLRWQRRFCRILPHVVTVSRTAAEKIARDYGRDVAAIRIVPNGVDAARFVPDLSATAEFDVIAMGSFVHPRKGFRFLLEAYRSLAAKGFRIADVGRRSGEQAEALKAIPAVRMHGTVTDHELLSLLQRSKVLVSTSLYEGFGLSLIEALACGHPAFAFGGGAVTEVLSPVDSGLVVPPEDTAELVRRVSLFLALSTQEQAARGERYRMEVERLYPLSRSADVLRQLYQELGK